MATYITELMQKNKSGDYDKVLVSGALPIVETITSAMWNSGKTAVVTVNGIDADSIIFVAPDPLSYTLYNQSGVYCVAQDNNSLTFVCTTIPSSDINVNIVLMA